MISYRAIVEASSRWIDRVAAAPARRAAETRLKFKMLKSAHDPKRQRAINDGKQHRRATTAVMLDIVGEVRLPASEIRSAHGFRRGRRAFQIFLRKRFAIPNGYRAGWMRRHRPA
jgi:hypothetical protein